MKKQANVRPLKTTRYNLPGRFPRRSLALLFAGILAALAQAAQLPTDRVIVKWRETGVMKIQIDSPVERAASLSRISGVRLTALRAIHDRLDVVRLAAPLRGEALRQTLNRLRNDPAVQYVEPDAKRYILAFPADPPSDPRFSSGSDAAGTWQGQWYLKDPALDPATNTTTLSAIGATTAWKNPTGPANSPVTGLGFVIAVLDTGVDGTHPDLLSKLYPGRDFVCNDSTADCLSSTANSYWIANDGDGWDNDASDPGDWISVADLDPVSGHFDASCGDPTVSDHHLDSSWHGTRVAGIAAAQTNNAAGIAGVAPDAMILPVRVIGKCGGYTSDIVAGMYWAAGLTNSAITGVASNPYPAHILNLSLGATNACTQTEQDAVTAITQDGHVIVAAAGNDGGPVGAPANCVGALSVAGLRHVGTKVGYSNVSSTAAAISIAAPAGNCYNVVGNRPWTLPCLYSIETTSNDGLTTPANPFYTYALLTQGSGINYDNEGTLGTSFAVPMVAGVAALMAQANGNLTVSQLIARMQASATPFPVPATPPAGGVCHVASLAQDAKGHYTDVQNADECQCTTATCGAGMLNAPAAVAAAQFPIASLTTSTDRASLGETVTLDGSSSAAATGYSLAYQWKADPDVSIANASSAVAKLVFPALRPVTVTLTVRDGAGRQDSVSKTIDSVAVKAGGSGGGGFDDTALAWLVSIALLAITARRRRQGAIDRAAG
ncbi:MAG: S8 family serine peptidase [Steroidobacteraceae bacterium]